MKCLDGTIDEEQISRVEQVDALVPRNYHKRYPTESCVPPQAVSAPGSSKGIHLVDRNKEPGQGAIIGTSEPAHSGGKPGGNPVHTAAVPGRSSARPLLSRTGFYQKAGHQ